MQIIGTIKRKVYTNWFNILVILVIIRAIIGWYGFERLPLISNNDEAMIQDPALSLARGTGLIAPSYRGQVFSELFAHHPPVFIWIQSIIFKLLGFSTFSLRGLGIINGFLSILVLILILRTLYKLKIVSKKVLVLTTLLVILDPISLSLSRMGRMDSTGNLFALLAIFSLFKLYESRQNFNVYYILPALLFGLSFSTHIQYISYYCYFIIFLVIVLDAIRKPVLFAVVSLFPLIVFCLIWLIAFGTRSVEAIQQMSAISSDFKGGINIGLFIFSIIRMNFQRFNQSGGTASLVIFLAWFLSLLASFLCLPLEKCRLSHPWLKLALLTSILQFTLLEFKFGLGMTRVYSLFPLSIITLAICMTQINLILNIKSRRKNPRKELIIILFSVLFSIIILFETMSSVAYTAKAFLEFKARNPDTFVNYVKNMKKSQKVLTEPIFWFAFMKNQYPVRIVEFGFVLGPEYWRKNPSELNKYDVLILRPSNPLFGDNPVFGNIWDNELKNFRQTERTTLNGNEFVVLEQIE